MAKNKDTSSINRTGIYDHTEGTITYIDPKGEAPELVFSIDDVFEKFDRQEISVTWNATFEALPVLEEVE